MDHPTIRDLPGQVRGAGRTQCFKPNAHADALVIKSDISTAAPPSLPRRTLACMTGRYTLVLTDPVTGRRRAVRWRCLSWRCKACRPLVARRDRQRVLSALRKRDHWIYVVLTIPHPRAYRLATASWNRLRLALNRNYGPVEYVATWERSQQGYPHLNLLVHSIDMKETWLLDDGVTLRRQLQAMATKRGFGWKTHVGDRLVLPSGFARIANYLTKTSTSRDHSKVVDWYDDTGESNEFYDDSGVELDEPCRDCEFGECERHRVEEEETQVPWDAPNHFRRLSASQGLLPLSRKGDEEGELVLGPFELYEARLALENELKNTKLVPEVQGEPSSAENENVPDMSVQLAKKAWIAELELLAAELPAVSPPIDVKERSNESLPAECRSPSAAKLVKRKKSFLRAFFSAVVPMVRTPALWILDRLENAFATPVGDGYLLVDDEGTIPARYRRVFFKVLGLQPGWRLEVNPVQTTTSVPGSEVQGA